MTTPVLLHCQGNRKTNKSLWGEQQSQQGCKPRCTSYSEGLVSCQRHWELRLCVLPETGQDLAAARNRTELAPVGNIKSLIASKSKRHFLAERSLAAVTHMRVLTQSAAPRAEMRCCLCKHLLPSAAPALQDQEYPQFRGVFLKQRPPWEDGSYCHSCGLKDVPLSSDTAANLGLNSDFV